MSLNPVIDLIANPLFSPVGDLSEWSLQGFPLPTLSSYWSSSTLLPANGSGGNIPFPAFNSYTPTAYTAPATNAPAGNAGFVGWLTGTICGAVYALPMLTAGTKYTVSFSYAGNPAATNLTWYFTTYVQMPDGRIGTSPDLNNLTFQTFSPANGWINFSMTFVADQTTSNATLFILGGGTNGTVQFNSSTLSGSTVMAPLLIASVMVTYQSQGARAFPPSALPVGTTTGTVMSGGDSRVPRLDSQFLLRPRMEAVQFDASAPNVGIMSPPRPVIIGPNGCYITTVSYTVESMSSGGLVVFDLTVNSVSIYQVTALSQLPTIVTTSGNPNTSPMTPSLVQRPNYFIGAGPVLLGGAVLQTSGTVQGIAITAWVYHP